MERMMDGYLFYNLVSLSWFLLQVPFLLVWVCIGYKAYLIGVRAAAPLECELGERKWLPSVV
jgi:hypothetical protein